MNETRLQMNSVQFVKDESFVKNGADDTVQSPQITKTDVNRHNRQTADADDNSVKKTSHVSGIAEVVNAMADSCCSQKALDMSNKSAHTDEVDAFSVLYEKIMDELETTDDGEYGTFSRKRKPRHQACSRDPNHIPSETRDQAADPSSQEQPSKSMKTQQNLSGQTPCSGAGRVPINSLHEVTITTAKCDLASESQCKLQSTPRNKHLNKTEHVSNHNNGVLCSPEHLVDKPNNAPSLCNVTKSAKDDGLGGATERVKWSAQASSPEGAIGATDTASPGGASEINCVSPGAECAARDTSNLENDNFVREKDIITDNNDSLSNDTRFHLFSCDINIDVNDTNAEDKTANSDEIKTTPITENQCKHDQCNRSDDTPDSKPHSETQDVMNRHSSSFSPSECGDVDIPERLAEHIGYDSPNECASGGKYSPLGMLEKTEPSKSEIPCTPLWRLDVTSSDRVWALRAADMSDFSDADTESISSQDTIMTMSTLTEQSSFIEECNKENGATEKDPINKNILASGRSVDEDTTDENITSNSNNNNNDYKVAGCCSSVKDGCHGNSACRETFSEQTISEKPNKEATEAAVSAVHYLCKKDVSLHKTDNYRYSKQHVKTAPAEQHVLTAIKTNFGYVDRSKVPSFRQMNAELRKSLTDMAGVERGAQSARKSPTEPLCIESKADIDDAIAEKAARKENSLTTSSPKDGAIHVNVTSSVEMKASHDRGSVSRADKVLPPASNDTAQSGAKEARKSHESCQASGRLIVHASRGHGLNDREPLARCGGGEDEVKKEGIEKKISCHSGVEKLGNKITTFTDTSDRTKVDYLVESPVIAASRDENHFGDRRHSTGSRFVADGIRSTPRRNLDLKTNISHCRSKFAGHTETEPIWVPLVTQTDESKSFREETSGTVNRDIHRVDAHFIPSKDRPVDNKNRSDLKAYPREDSVHDGKDKNRSDFNVNVHKDNTGDTNERLVPDTIKSAYDKNVTVLNRGPSQNEDTDCASRGCTNTACTHREAKLKHKFSDNGPRNSCASDLNIIKTPFKENRKRSKSDSATSGDTGPDVSHSKVKSVSTQAFFENSQVRRSSEHLNNMPKPRSNLSSSSENTDSTSTSSSSDSADTSDVYLRTVVYDKMSKRGVSQRDVSERAVTSDKKVHENEVLDRGRSLHKRKDNVNMHGSAAARQAAKSNSRKVDEKKRDAQYSSAKLRPKLQPLDCSSQLRTKPDSTSSPTTPGNHASQKLRTEKDPPSPASPGDHLNTMLDQMVKHLKDLNTSGSIENIYKFSQLQLPNFDKYKDKTRNKSESPVERVNKKQNCGLDEVDTIERRRRAKSMDSRPRLKNSDVLLEKETVGSLNRVRSKDDALGVTDAIETLCRVRAKDDLPPFLRSTSTQTSKRFEDQGARVTAPPRSQTTACHMPHKGTCDVEKLEQYTRSRPQQPPNPQRLFRRHTTTISNYPRRPWLPTEDFFQKEKMKTLGPSFSREFRLNAATQPNACELEKFVARDSQRIEKIRQRYKSSPEMRNNELESNVQEQDKFQVGRRELEALQSAAPDPILSGEQHAPVSPAEVRKTSLLSPETYSPRPRRSILPTNKVISVITESQDNIYQSQEPLDQPRYCSKYELHMEKPRNFAEQARSFTNRCLQLLHKGKQKKSPEGSKMETPAINDGATSKTRFKTSTRKFHSKRNEPLSKKTYSSPDITSSDCEPQYEATKFRYEADMWTQPSASKDSVLCQQEGYFENRARQPFDVADDDFEDVFVPPWSERSPPDGAPSNSPRDSKVMDGEFRDDSSLKSKKLRPKSCYV